MNSAISIITVVLNDRAGFEKTARSIVGQDYLDLDWIVIDGGSTDGTTDAIKSVSDRISYLVSERDNGLYHAMNKGLEHAKGEWVNFMNSGDIFADDTTVSRVMTADLSGIDLVYGDTLAAYHHGPVLKKAGSADELDKGMVLCHQSVFVRTAVAKRAGFDLNYRIGADYDQLLKLRMQGCFFRQVSFPIAIINAQGTSNRKMARSAREHFTIVQKYRRLTIPEKLYHAGFIAWCSLVSLGYMLLPEKVMHSIARVK
ncbi:MAG: glycosyltransferase family 2 protein [Bacteroidales bacterium]|nr:glycosyltransferase family 2 protein [Bacteroidales bacterium]